MYKEILDELEKWVIRKRDDAYTLSSLPATKQSKEQYKLTYAIYDSVLYKILELKGD